MRKSFFSLSDFHWILTSHDWRKRDAHGQQFVEEDLYRLDCCAIPKNSKNHNTKLYEREKEQLRLQPVITHLSLSNEMVAEPSHFLFRRFDSFNLGPFPK